MYKTMVLILTGILIMFPLGSIFSAETLGYANPNPFKIQTASSKTQINVTHSTTYAASYYIKIYDMMGRLVRSWSRTNQSSSFYEEWDGKNAKNKQVRSGIYIIFIRRVVDQNNEKDASSIFRLAVLKDY